MTMITEHYIATDPRILMISFMLIFNYFKIANIISLSHSILLL